ncbi:metal-dependent hydrolase [Parasphingopyxis sp. CP4]|uniref:metal-dependent hydrolase n=1 Tax=Parasphingopyxis sp. CP4 TaxID=2724527 RepID=UPI0015A10CF4|nr:metal-dependent hydrolase [Parasphingopyxis sp. CP4]QLC20745.1 metal-dependent hydrolase [Parasphingopyxis sp. CP4]
MAKDKTPVDLEITPRDRRFGRETSQDRWWYNNDPVGTAFFNALSVTFPRGEAYFIEAVKAHRKGVPPKLAGEIRAFVQQEVMHSREHVAFNRKVSETGYDISPLEKVVEESLEATKDRPAIVDLAVTMALEHYTALLAQQILKNEKGFASADPEWANLWRWHAIEEIEHKGVAYDTWMHATKDWSRWQRWKVKSRVMLLVTMMFWPKRVRGMKALLAQDGITGARAMGRILWFMFGTPGMLRKALPQWIAYFLPGFHPWNHDDRELIRLADSDYSDAVMQPEKEALAA